MNEFNLLSGNEYGIVGLALGLLSTMLAIFLWLGRSSLGLLRQLIGEMAENREQNAGQTQALISMQTTAGSSQMAQAERYLGALEKLQTILDSLQTRTSDNFTKGLENHQATQAVTSRIHEDLKDNFSRVHDAFGKQTEALGEVKTNLQDLQRMLRVATASLDVIAIKVDKIETGKPDEPTVPIPASGS